MGLTLAVGVAELVAAEDVELPPAQVLRRDVLERVESLRVRDAGAPYGVYRMEEGRKPDLYASCDAALIRYILGDLDLEPRQRLEWIEHINSYQDRITGKYPAARFLHLFGTAIRALNALGGRPRHPLVFMKEWDDPERTKKWMDGLSWNSPWEPSIQILHVATPRAALAASQPANGPDRQWVNGVLDWLDSRQDPKTGLWGTDRRSGLFDGMGATFHFLPVYEAAGRPIGHGHELIKSVLSIQKSKYGTWGGVYADMDAVSMLVYFYHQEGSPREDIERSVRTSIDLLFKTAYKPKTRSFGDLGNTLGACEHIAEAARVLKNHPYTGLSWRRAWDWRLWKCNWPSTTQASTRTAIDLSSPPREAIGISVCQVRSDNQIGPARP